MEVLSAFFAIVVEIILAVVKIAITYTLILGVLVIVILALVMIVLERFKNETGRINSSARSER